MAEELVQWLQRHGLGQYAQAFSENRIDVDIFPDLSEPDLEKLDIPLGDRKRLLRAMAELSEGSATDAEATSEASAPTPSQSEAERRQLTVMFCDLVGSTPLASRLDPEDMREVIRAYQNACADVIARYDGYIAKYMGDGILVYFGYPRAHEDDAERAILAGLGTVEAIAALNTRRGDGSTLSVRVGIATGKVVVGDLVGEGASREAAITGETPNLAARLQDIAKPDTVVVAPSTYRLAGARFECRDLGPRDLKGFDSPVRSWSIVRPRRSESRFGATRSESLTKLVGRDEEVEILVRRWQRAKQGEGEIVLISGEPGIGKSRLALALEERIADQPYTPFRLQCSPFHINSAWHPLIEQIERSADFEPGDTNDVKLDKLESLLQLTEGPLEEFVPLVAALLSVQADERYAPLNMSPQHQKQLTLHMVATRIASLARIRPVVFTCEDAQWIDPTTLEFLDLIVEHAPDSAILVVVTYRPEFTAPWIGRPRVTALALNRLDRRHGAALLANVTGGRSLPQEVLNQIVAKTDGVPLFVEELTKSVIESGLVREEDGRYVLIGQLPALAIPETLQDLLMARLDRLASAKEVAQAGAAIGREFSYHLLADVSRLGDDELRNSLVRLVDAGLFLCRGSIPDMICTFKHALIQDVAYASLLRGRRKQLHQSIAQALEETDPEIAATEPEILAHHYTEAGLSDQAIAYWLKAGQRAMSRFANVEANCHLRMGLTVLESLPESSQRDRQELSLQTTLGMSLLASEGFGAPDVERAFRRAKMLCRDLGDTPELIPVLWGTWWFHEVRAELETAGEMARQLYDLARRQPDRGALLPACRAMAQTLFWRGEFAAARPYLEQAIAIYEPDRHRSHALLYGQDPGVASRNFLAHSLWFLGYPDQALARAQEALAQEAEFSHPFSHAFAASWASLLHLYRGEIHRALEHAEAAATLSREQGFPFFLALATMLRGAALAEQGRAEEGIAEMLAGLDMYRATGANTETKLALGLIAEALKKIGRHEEGLQLLTDALAAPDTREVRCYEAELRRLKGRFLLEWKSCAPKVEEGEASFLAAIEIARSQNAKSWELRAATDLASLWRSQGKLTEARGLLVPVYEWFTEGINTADLKEAKALINELN